LQSDRLAWLALLCSYRPIHPCTQQVVSALNQMCVEVHTSVEEQSTKFYTQLRRRYYTTPKSYLDMISLFLQLLAAKRCVAGAADDG